MKYVSKLTDARRASRDNFPCLIKKDCESLLYIQRKG